VSGLERELRASLAPVVAGGRARCRDDLSQTVGESGLRTARPIAVAIAAVALLARALSPSSRAASCPDGDPRLAGIGGARIVRVDELPPFRSARLRRARPADEFRRRADGGLGSPLPSPPRDAGLPDEVRLAPRASVSLHLARRRRRAPLSHAVPGRVGEPGASEEARGRRTAFDRFEVDGDPAVWLEGGPHAVLFVAPDGRSATTRLARRQHPLVDRDGVTMRVEGRSVREAPSSSSGLRAAVGATSLVRGIEPTRWVGTPFGGSDHLNEG
jgi:hypothetical protein